MGQVQNDLLYLFRSILNLTGRDLPDLEQAYLDKEGVLRGQLDYRWRQYARDFLPALYLLGMSSFGIRSYLRDNPPTPTSEPILNRDSSYLEARTGEVISSR